MPPVRENSNYRPTFNRTHERLAYEIFIVEVLTVDYERKVLTVEDVKDGLVYTEVSVFPANYSGLTGGDANMPEQGSLGLAANYSYERGYRQVMILGWVNAQQYPSVDAIASRQISGDRIQGYSDRLRATWRKATPGQRTASYTGGFSEKVDTSWDKQSAAMDRDKADSDKRQWTQIAGRRVAYSDAGMSLQGSVNRPNTTAPTVVPVILPDGTSDYIVYLAPGSQPSDRYVQGKQDVIPFSESTDLIQEYALDYPVPYEVLQTDLLNTILGATADPWGRTTVTPAAGNVPAFDSETFTVDQGWDDPFDDRVAAVGPTLSEGATPARRAYILERAQGTLVGYNLYDKSTYGFVLKPVLFPYNYLGRFGSVVESGYLPVNDSADHVEARLAASCLAIRFPYEQNTTRLDVTKEGFTSLEIGSTLPKENIPLNSGTASSPGQVYEHPHGAGRSLEAHLVGSAKLVVGKNRDEEDAIDAQILGQSVLRFGADDTSLPTAERTVLTQTRSQGDKVVPRTLQYWKKSKLVPGDAVSLTRKVGAENISIRAAMDGGTVIRLGAKNPLSKRRHLVNGYVDGPGKKAYSIGDGTTTVTDDGTTYVGRVDSKSSGRPDYGAGDNIYQFHDLTQAGSPPPANNFPPYSWSGPPVTNMDASGLSLDLHAVRDVLVRAGANPATGQSLLVDLAGGLVLALGKDLMGRSVTAELDGGIEITILPNAQGKAMRFNIIGDIDITHQGNLQYHCTGDMVTEATTSRSIVKTDRIETQQKAISSSLARDTTEAPDIVNNQGLYQSDENS
jgi:hypothetical protein